jgi:MFS family permease
MAVAPPEARTGSVGAASIALFCLGTFLFWSSLYVYVPVLSVYAQSLGAPLSLVGLVVGMYGAVQLVVRVPLGFWSDRLGRRKPFILFGMVACGLGSLGLAYAPSPWFLVLSRGVLGLGAATWVAFSVLFASYYPHNRTAQAMSLISFFNGAAQAIAGLAGGYISQASGPGATFYAGTAIALVGLLVMLGVPDVPQPKGTPISVGRLWVIARTPALLFASGIALLSYLAMFTTTFTFIPIYARSLNATDGELGLLQTATLVAYTLASLAGATLAERVGERRLLVFGMAFAGVATALTPLAGGLVPLALTQIAGALGRGVCIPTLLSLAIRPLPSQERASGMGVFQALYSIGMFVGPPLGGFIADSRGLSAVFVGVAAICVLAATWAASTRALGDAA